MNVERATVLGVVAVVVGTTVLSGGVVDLVDERPSLAAAGDGDAAVTVESVPLDSLALVPADGQPGYRLASDPARVQVDSVDGQPLLAFELRIPGLGFSSVRKYVLTTATTGPTTIRLVGGTFEDEDVDRDAYEATVTIRVEGDRTRTLYRGNTTVEVQR